MTAPTPPVTSVSPFATAAAPRERAGWKRFLGVGAQDAAEQSLVALLAAQDARQLTSADVRAALAKENVSQAKADAARRAVFGRALDTFLADDVLSPDEQDYLAALRTALELDPVDTKHLLREATRPRLERVVRAAVADGTVTAAERLAITRTAAALQVSESDTRDLLVAAVSPLLTAQLEAMIQDRRYSPVEEQRLRDQARALGVANLSFDAGTEQALAHYRTLWSVEQGELPTFTPPIALQRGEVCHFTAPCRWLEHRMRTTRVHYAGAQASIRIAKGVRFRVGSVAPRRVAETELVQLDNGDLYVTNKRVVFVAALGNNKMVRLSALLGVEIYADALVLDKAQGKTPYLALVGGPEAHELGGAILSELLARAGD